MRRLFLLLSLLGLALSGTVVAQAAQGPVIVATKPIPGSYIVVLNPSTAQPDRTAATLSRRYGGTPQSYYRSTLYGFSTRGLTASQATRLAADPLVRTVYQDGTARAAQAAVPWGLDRLDQRQLPLDNRPFASRGGAGATAYLIDSGITSNQAEFGTRARVGADFLGGTGVDCHGHGTHVAGVVGGKTHGAAKETALVALRVLGCDGLGRDSHVLDAVEWVTRNGTRPAVVTMSVTMDQAGAGDEAVRRSIDAEFTYVVAAGNDSADSCGFSPGRVSEAITVAATDRTDTRPAWSNYGRCVDFFAPGSDIPSLGRLGQEVRMSGTSVAAAHVAGIVAGYIARNPFAMPADVRVALSRAMVTGAVLSPGDGSPNQLANVAYPLDPEVPTCRGGANTTDVVIPDNGTTATSVIGVGGCPPTGAPGRVRVYLDHADVNDLRIDLVDPLGRVYELEQVGGTDPVGPLRKIYAISPPGGDRNGAWTLRVSDQVRTGTGRLDQWVLSFG
ncbi:S8 family serine peptidase [Actinokineospora diospyrosa]|uniref:Serine protease, subtilisin family n=1 Tax=Actinokineospora diospyrosa TaxID=103728 RepID=A0ABT1IMA4_9PSEU|nr:S8 family serine peptidase [Actinokineospora diospyrosa]MCP2273787.1 Serine protease, subtilisin family [Actinokineospora diospyrosa]